MDKVRPVEAALLIGVLSVVLNPFAPRVEMGSITIHLSPVDMVFLAVGASALLLRWREARGILQRNRTYFLLSGLFLLSVLLSALLSPHPAVSLKDTVQVTGYLWVLPFVLAYSPNVPWVYRNGGKVLVLLSSLLLLPYFYLYGWVRFNPFNLHPNFTGFLFALFAVVLAHYGSTTLSVLSVLITSMTFSRSAMGSLFSALILKGFLTRRRMAFYLTSALLTATLLFVSPYALRGFLVARDYVRNHVLPVAAQEEEFKPAIGVVRGKSYEILRVLMWKATYDMWRKRPLVGIGFGRYREEWREECSRGELPKEVCTKWVENVDPHNVFVQVLSETGVLGATTFLLLLLFVLLRVLREPLSLTVFLMTLLFGLLQPFPLFTRNLAPLVWLLLFYGGVVKWKGS